MTWIRLRSVIVTADRKPDKSPSDYTVCTNFTKTSMVCTVAIPYVVCSIRSAITATAELLVAFSEGWVTSAPTCSVPAGSYAYTATSNRKDYGVRSVGLGFFGRIMRKSGDSLEKDMIDIVLCRENGQEA